MLGAKSRDKNVNQNAEVLARNHLHATNSTLHESLLGGAGAVHPCRPRSKDRGGSPQRDVQG